jgi:hypothetical protein
MAGHQDSLTAEHKDCWTAGRLDGWTARKQDDWTACRLNLRKASRLDGTSTHAMKPSTVASKNMEFSENIFATTSVSIAWVFLQLRIFVKLD